MFLICASDCEAGAKISNLMRRKFRSLSYKEGSCVDERLNMLARGLNARGFIWVCLALPAAAMLLALMRGDVGPDGAAATEFLLHPTGETSARLMILALMLTPLRMLFPASRLIAWLVQRRRYIGVAAFGYAAFHLVLYVADMGSLRAIWGEAFVLGIWTGWLARFIFVPLAVTSNDYWVRRLRKSWKPLQRLVYPAAVLTLLHWIFVHNELGPALAHFVPLIGLEAYRVWRAVNRRRPAAHHT
jgi:sulfoxide reductase heme-binding subunit YedZ